MLFKSQCAARALWSMPFRGFAALVIALSYVAAAQAGPGHDHGPSSAAPAGPSSPRIVAQSEAYELVGILKGGDLTIYLDRRKDTSPVTDAQLELIIDGATQQAQPADGGTYQVSSPELLKDGTHEVIVTINHDGASDLLVGSLEVGAEEHSHSHSDGHDSHSDSATSNDRTVLERALDAVGVSTGTWTSQALLTAAGLGLGLLIGLTARGRKGLVFGLIGLVGLLVVSGVGVAWAGPGHDHGGTSTGANGDAPRRLPDGKLFLPKPTQRLLNIRTRILQPRETRATVRLIGEVIPDPNRAGLVQSTIGGRIRPADSGLPTLGQKVKAGETLAFVEPAFAPIDASDVRQTAGDLRQKIAVLEARVARQQKLVDRDVASRANLEDLMIELEGLKVRRTELKAARTEPEALKAPVDGVIAEVRVSAGQVVQSGRTLFHIIDPSNLWVEAISYDPALAFDGSKVEARDGTGNTYPLSYVGRSRALQQQAVRIQLKIDAPSGALHVGTPMKVFLEVGDNFEGLIVPRKAIAQAPNGQMVAFKRLAPEQYEPVAVRFEEVDVDRVHVTGGLKPGDQIITTGAPLVNQIR